MIKHSFKHYQNESVLPVIIAGGIGNRIAPLSTFEHPKQFIKFLPNNKSLFQTTIERIKKCFNKTIAIIINKHHIGIVKQQLREINFDNYIIICEAECNNNFVSSLLSCKFAKQNKYKHIFIFPSDHMIENENNFYVFVENAIKNTIQNDKHIICGIKPTSANIQYGYIKISKNNIDQDDIYKVDNFIEKPPFELAIKFVENENYLWNSGMFLLNIDTFLKEVKKKQFASFQAYQQLYFTKINNKIFSFNTEICNLIIKKSIDYAIIEKSKNLLCIKAHFDWCDVGSFQILNKLLNENKISLTNEQIKKIV